MRFKQETYSNLLLDFMRKHKDNRFTIEELVFFTDITRNRVGAALAHLMRVKCVDALPKGEVMEYLALPEEMDTRLKIILERKPEESGSRKRKRKNVKR